MWFYNILAFALRRPFFTNAHIELKYSMKILVINITNSSHNRMCFEWGFIHSLFVSLTRLCLACSSCFSYSLLVNKY